MPSPGRLGCIADYIGHRVYHPTSTYDDDRDDDYHIRHRVQEKQFFSGNIESIWVKQAVASDFDHKRVVRRSLLLAVNLGALVVYFQLSSFCPRHVKHKYENTEDQSKQLVIMIAVTLFIENILLHNNITLIMKQYGVV